MTSGGKFRVFLKKLEDFLSFESRKYYLKEVKPINFGVESNFTY
jgi:hypothetical protein